MDLELLTPAEREQAQVTLLRIHNARVRRRKYAALADVARRFDPRRCYEVRIALRAFHRAAARRCRHEARAL